MTTLTRHSGGGCSDGDTCPSVDRTDHGTVVTVGQRVTDPAVLAQLDIGDGEAAVEFPASLIPELADPAELTSYINAWARTRLFRLETLPEYHVGSDGGDFRRYLDGATGPDPVRKQASHKALRARRDRGISIRRVRVIHAPITPYELYACEWGYALNTVYEDIRVIDLAARRLPPELAGVGDFWLMNDAAALMRYDRQGQYAGFIEAPMAFVTAAYAMIADAAWNAGEPFTAWWNAHPQYRREGRRAA